MKIVKFYATTLAVFALTLLLTDVPALAQQLRGNGKIITQERQVSGFTGIEIGGGFQVEVSKGSKEGVRLEVEENLMDRVKTEVKDGVLHIYNDGGITTSKGMKAYITVKDLNKVGVSGGVKLTGKSTFKANTFELDLSGGSKIALAIDTKKLKADMSGASKVDLAGKADEVEMDMSGASSVDAEELETKRMKIGASGASKVKVYAKESLDISASGASSVQYKGSPNITSDVSAAARISKL
ncbi:head GIN domain-containing protein [Pontibacter ruber]|uniref:Head GIN domain-containing protein n=1 Tax=Pontibacter ruber TaxID=1343895 RepID=A0ABW5CWH1_9BACT|nr:head GIN domain-containing protein [Pontibacter ruber]